MDLPAFSVRNRIFVNLLFLLGLVVGVWAFTGNVVDVYPDISFDQGQVFVAWPGASPEEVEAQVTRKVEDEILDIKGIDRVVSSSERDLCLVDVKFREDISQDAFERAFEELRARVGRVEDLPEGSETPVVSKLTVGEIFPLLQVVIASDGASPRRTLREIAVLLREKLRQVEGVAKVGDIGIPDVEWKVLVRRRAMESAGLDLLGVGDRLRARHLNVPAGTLAAERGEAALTAQGEFPDVAAVGRCVVGYRPDTSPVRLEEIADVQVGFEKETFRQRYNGRDAIILSVAKNPDADSIATKASVMAALDEFERSQPLPPDVSLGTAMDSTLIIRNRIRVLLENLGFGIVLVFLMLWLVVGARNSVLALLGIPFSFLVALAVLSAMGVTINAITLFSLVLVSGMVVDDAIVVLENIYRKVEEGLPLRRAAVEGAREVVGPVTSSTLTTLAAFLPMLIMTGVTGEFMSIIPKTVLAVLLASLLECFVVLPAHYLHLGGRKPSRGIVAGAGAVVTRAGAVYERVLGRLVRRPSLVLLFTLVLAAAAAGVWRSLPTNLFPSDFQAFYCNVFLDPEYGLEGTAEATRELEAMLRDLMPEKVEAFTTAIGVTFTDDLQLLRKPNVAQLLVYIPQEWNREHSPEDVIREVRERADRLVATDPDRRFLRIKVDAFKDGPPVGKPVAVRVACGDYAVGKSVAREITGYLESLPGVHSVSDNLDPGPREVRVVPRDVRAARAGVDFADVARLVYAANEGIEVGDVLEPGTQTEATLRLLLRPEDRRRPEDLLRLRLPSRATGRPRTVEEVATLEVRRGLASLYHYDGERVVLVTADVDTSVTDSPQVNRLLMERFDDVESRHPGVRLGFGGEFAETEKSFSSLRSAFGVAVILIYTILAAQFRSYVLPLVVMVVVPFSFIGVVLGLWTLGFPFTIMAFIAIVGLSGVVVNDSLVLVDFIARYQREGGDPVAAMLRACRTRLRPVVLTTVTTVLGLLPMALGLTGYSPIWSPFAATITFGLSLAMLLTLFLVPAAYALFDATTRRARRAARVSRDSP